MLFRKSRSVGLTLLTVSHHVSPLTYFHVLMGCAESYDHIQKLPHLYTASISCFSHTRDMRRPSDPSRFDHFSVFRKRWTSWAYSLRNFLQPPVAWFLLDPESLISVTVLSKPIQYQAGRGTGGFPPRNVHFMQVKMLKYEERRPTTCNN